MAQPAEVLPLTTRQAAWRLFFTTWIVFTLFFATNVVREHYPAIALGDRFSFDLDGYCGLHPDLFETPGRGCHSGNNPGVSMVAAIPYALARPVIDRIVARVQAARLAANDTVPPAYNTPSPNSRRFYAEVYRRGLDVKLELAAFVMQAFCMAPSSALAVTLLFIVLVNVLGASRRVALWLALLYAFGTPVLFRTAFLNHNLMLGHIAFAGFVLVWNPWRGARLSEAARETWCGVAGGLTILFDYTGVVFIVGLGGYVVLRRWLRGERSEAVKAGVRYVLGTLGPVALLWWYQYRAFGSPFLPGQHWMPPVQWSDRGYQGYQFPPVPELLSMLLFDYRFGLLLSAPALVPALVAVFVERGPARRVPPLELAVMLLLSLGTWLFFGGSNYVRLQFNTGIRYLTCIFPFLFVPAALVLTRIRPAAAFAWALAGLSVAIPLAMYRIVQEPLGLLDPMVRTFTAGFTLPVLRTLGETVGQYGDFVLKGTSPLPLFAITAAVIWAIWTVRLRTPLKIEELVSRRL